MRRFYKIFALSATMLAALLTGCGDGKIDVDKYEHTVVWPEAPKAEGGPVGGGQTQTGVTGGEDDGIDFNSLGDTSKIEHLEGKTPTGANFEIKDGITYVDGMIFVNKTFRLPSTYIPSNTHVAITAETEYDYNAIDNMVWAAWEELKAASEEEGLNLYFGSGYRSFYCQEWLFRNYVDISGYDEALRYSARAGHSEHQTSFCFDLNTVTDEFADTAEGKWVNDHAYEYGFIIRYPKGKEDETGYKYESWHLRYVGKELAKTLYNNGDWITLEAYFGLPSKYPQEELDAGY